jgi:hypothetical protein
MEPSLVHIWWRMSKPHMDSVRHLYEYILVGKLCVKTVRDDNATGDVRGRPWGWHGFGVARAGLVGNGDPRSLPTAGRLLLLCVGRMKCLSCPDRPSAVPVQDTRPQRAEDPGVARIAVAAIPDRDAIAAYDQPCILDGWSDQAPGGLGRSARRLPSRCEKAEQLVRLGRRLARGRYRMTAWPRAALIETD